MDMQLRRSNDPRRSAHTLASDFERTGRTQSVLRNRPNNSALENVIWGAVLWKTAFRGGHLYPANPVHPTFRTPEFKCCQNNY